MCGRQLVVKKTCRRPARKHRLHERERERKRIACVAVSTTATTGKFTLGDKRASGSREESEGSLREPKQLEHGRWSAVATELR